MSEEKELNKEELKKVSGGYDDGQSYILFYRDTELDTDKTIQETLNLYPELKELENQYSEIKPYKGLKLSLICKVYGQTRVQTMLDKAIGYNRASA